MLIVTLSTSRRVPVVKYLSKPATEVLWAIGVVQNYHLFDWINRFNYHVEQASSYIPEGKREKVRLNYYGMIPRSVRYTVYQVRLYDILWVLKIPDEINEELKEDIRYRIAKKHCKHVGEDGFYQYKTTLHHVLPNNIDLKKEPRIFKTTFICKNNEPYNVRERRIQ